MTAWSQMLPILAALGLGCNPYTITTEVRLRDPARASLRTGADPASTFVPEGRAPQQALGARGVRATGPTSSASYEIRGIRDASGALAFEVDTKLPLVNGERHEIVLPDGEVVALPGGVVSPGMLGAPASDLVLPVCVDLEEARGGVRAVAGGCSDRSTSRSYLVTPWDNVEVIREAKRVRGRGLAILGAVLFATPPTAGGAALIALGASPRQNDRATYLGVGIPALCLGAALFALYGPAMVMPDRMEVLFPRPTPR